MMNIYQSIPAIMLDMGVVGKDKKNAQQGFMFRGIDDVMNATNPFMAKHKVFVVPNVIERIREERTTKAGGAMYLTLLRVEFTFYAEDGTFVKAVTDGEAMDTGDKGTNKAMSIAFKYALFQVFNIPTEEMKDPDAETPEPTTAKTSSKFVSKSQSKELIELCKNADGTWDKEKILQLKAMGYNDTNEIPTTQFELVKKLLEDKKHE
jgi:hypothetical protein